MKTLLYIFQCLSEDVESQKRGIVMISFPSINFDPSTISNPRAKALISEILDSISVRITGNHLNFPDKPWFRALGALFLMAATPSVRVRTRFHFGKMFLTFDGLALIFAQFVVLHFHNHLNCCPRLFERFHNRMSVQNAVIRNTKWSASN